MSYLWNTSEIKKALNRRLTKFNEDHEFSIMNVTFDSREVAEGSLFIAKKGEHTDGHIFIKNVLEKNENVAVIACDALAREFESDPRVILVDDTIEAIKDLAVFRRNQLTNTRIIAITGSIGKTSTKDFLYTILSHFGKAHCNQMSFNNFFGLMFTMLNTGTDLDYVIYEMGTSGKGEIKMLVDFVRPEISLITNIERAHFEYFKNDEEIAFEKSEILTNTSKCAVLNKDNKFFDFLAAKASKYNLNLVSFGENSKADVFLKNFCIDGNTTNVIYVIDGQEFHLSLDNKDYNLPSIALRVLAIAHALNIDIKKVFTYLNQYKTTRGRNNIEEVQCNIKGKDIHITVINGSANAVNPKAFISGFELFKNKDYISRRKVCFFGPIKEAGSQTEDFHLTIAQQILKYGVDVAILFGDETQITYDFLKKNNFNTVHYDSVYNVLEDIQDLVQDGDVLFIKSSKYLGKSYEIINYLVPNNKM